MRNWTFFYGPARLALLSVALLVAPLSGVSMGQAGGEVTAQVRGDDGDDGFDWGWLGLIGLAGLLGLRRNDRDHTVRHTA